MSFIFFILICATITSWKFQFINEILETCEYDLKPKTMVITNTLITIFTTVMRYNKSTLHSYMIILYEYKIFIFIYTIVVLWWSKYAE